METQPTEQFDEEEVAERQEEEEEGEEEAMPGRAGYAAGPEHTPEERKELLTLAISRGLNPKAMMHCTPDLFKMALAIEVYMDAHKHLSPHALSVVLSNALVLHRAARGSQAQDWMAALLVPTTMILVGGGDCVHAEAMRQSCELVLDKSRIHIAEHHLAANWLCHAEGRARNLSGESAMVAGATEEGCKHLATIAVKLQEVVLDVLVAKRSGTTHKLSADDVMFAQLAFYRRLPLATRRPPGKAGGPACSSGAQLEPTVMLANWYNAVNAGWSLVCWAVLGGHATLGPMSRASYALNVLGQQEKSIELLAALGVKSHADFNVLHEEVERISPQKLLIIRFSSCTSRRY